MSELAASLAHPAGQLSEVEMVRRVRDGDSDLFYELVRPYERRVYSAAFAILRNSADAEDAAQEAMLRPFGTSSNFARKRGSAPG